MFEMREISWTEVFKRIGDFGQIRSVIEGQTLQGPLSGISGEHGIATFDSPWCATHDPKTGKWKLWQGKVVEVGMAQTKPFEDTRGRILIIVPSANTIHTLFPKGDSELEPRMVEGLFKKWEQSLADSPWLTLDHETARRVALESTPQFISVCQVLAELPAGATLHDLLAHFTDEREPERFLRLYMVATLEGCAP